MRMHLPTLLALLASPLAAADFAIEVAEKEHITISLEGKTVARLMMAHDTSTPEIHHDTYKPYLHVFDPAGTAPITKGPGGSFTHHRGIFVGYNKIQFDGKSFDRWHMKGGDQIVRKITSQEGGKGRAHFATEIEWQGENGGPLLTEQRRFDFTAPDAPFYLGIELNSSIEPASGEAVMEGDPEHAGAQFRPAASIDPAKTIYLFPGENTDPRKDRDLPWVAEIFTLEDRVYTALLLNHPDNAKDTAFSAYRDYGRFGAFPRGVAKPGAPFKLRYKWLVAEGEVRDPAIFQKAANDFTGQSSPVPAITERASQVKQAKPKAKQK